MTTFHEEPAVDWWDALEVVDDGPATPEEAAAEGAQRDWAEEQLATIPELAECDFCAAECLTPHGPVVEGVPDGFVVHRRGEWRYACDGCVEDAVEDGWSRW